MGGGVVTGALVGAVLSGVALAAVSIALPVRTVEPDVVAGPDAVPAAVAPEVAEPAEEDVPEAVVAAVRPDGEVVAATPEIVSPQIVVEVDPAEEGPAAPVVAEAAADAFVEEAPEIVVVEADEVTVRPQAREVAAVPVFPAAPEVEDPAPAPVVAEPVQPDVSEEADEVVVRSVPIDPVTPAAPSAAPEAPVAEAAPAAPEALPEPDVIVIADAPGEAAPAEEVAEPEPDLPPEGPALEVAAIGFEPTARPAMGIVLEDVGALPDAGDVANLPFPLTVIVDPAREDAAERMGFWREAGAEIALSADLPGGASAGDAATLLDAWRRAVPWAVAAVEDTPGAFQGGALRQMLSGLSESGHGVLLHSRGLNSARAEAEREGVPAGLIFRDIDGAGETPVIIRRFLDQAAFRASRNDGVILKGRTTPETIETIRDWSLEGRGRTVAISPLSAMLPREAN